MKNNCILLALAGLATSTPVARQAPWFPPLIQSQGFTLVANQTDPGSLHGHVVTTAHIGAGTSLAVLSDPSAAGRVFYLNGTAAEWRSRDTHVLTDGGSPLSPWGLEVVEEASGSGAHGVTVLAGSGTKTYLASFPDRVPELLNFQGRGRWVGCEQYVRPVNANLMVLGYVYIKEGETEATVPEGCVAVNLLPQCAELPALPEGSLSSHEFALQVQCYENVLGADWVGP